jgi:predicted O-methyltransferase YrrM
MRIEPGRQRTNLLNVLRFVIANPQSIPILAGKVVKRVRDRSSASSIADNQKWIEDSAIASHSLAMRLDGPLWNEALEFGEHLRERAAKILSSVPFDMGGGGNYVLLYWMTRYLRPTYVVETGVAAGWSSEAFLTAMDKNGHGTLYSSDLPYFRVRDAAKYIGILVSERVRSRWHLLTSGDGKALPQIITEIPHVDLFHYDSDKSYSGRQFAVGIIAPRLSSSGVILVDDITDDPWFHDYSVSSDWANAVVDARSGLIDPSKRLLS